MEEVIRKLEKNPKFEEAILNKIGSRIDTEEIEKEIEGLEKQHKQLTGAKARLGQQMDSLDHEHILSGILRCPLCGSGMYGNVNRKKKKDGTYSETGEES